MLRWAVSGRGKAPMGAFRPALCANHKIMRCLFIKRSARLSAAQSGPVTTEDSTSKGESLTSSRA